MPKDTSQKSRTRLIVSAVAAVLLVAAIVVYFVTRNQSEDPVTNSTIAMGTVINQSIYADEDSANTTIAQVGKIINDIDRKKLSWRIEGSDVYKVNQSGSATVSDTTLNCIKTCLGVSEKSNGLFDITVGDLTGLWNIGTEDARLPRPEEIQSVLGLIDWTKVSVGDASVVSIGENQKLDLGAVGKGLACDEVRTALKKTDTKGAVVSVGGSILIYGKNPNAKDGSYNIGVRDPFGGANDYAAVINYGEGCISTSGDYEKVLEVDGKKYHHILNPKTGYPAESNITGVTIVSNSGTLSDALSTACFILGYSKESMDLLKSYNSEALFITKDKKIYITDGLKDKVTITNDAFTAYSSTTGAAL